MLEEQSETQRRVLLVLGETLILSSGYSSGCLVCIWCSGFLVDGISCRYSIVSHTLVRKTDSDTIVFIVHEHAKIQVTEFQKDVNALLLRPTHCNESPPSGFFFGGLLLG
jgi:hypothetical protein